MPATNARNTGLPVVHVLRKSFTFADIVTIGGGTILIGTIPGGSMLLACFSRIDVVWNAGSTNVLTVGQNATRDDIAAAADIDEATLGKTQNTSAAALPAITGDTDIFAKFAQTGTPASAGAATIVVTYVPPM